MGNGSLIKIFFIKISENVWLKTVGLMKDQRPFRNEPEIKLKQCGLTTYVKSFDRALFGGNYIRRKRLQKHYTKEGTQNPGTIH